MAIEKKVVHFTVTGEFLTEHARELFVEDTPKKAVEFLTISLIGMPVEMAWDIVLGKTQVTGDSDEGCGIADNEATELYGIPLTTASCWSRLARQYFNRLGELQSLQRRIMLLGNYDKQHGALYRTCGFEIWNDYVISLSEDRKVYLKKKAIFDELTKEIIFIGTYIGKSLADLPILTFEVQTDINEVSYALRNGFKESFNLEYLLHQPIETIVLPDDDRKKRLADYIGNNKGVSAVDSYLEAQKIIDSTLKEGIKPTPISEPKSAGWIAPNGDYYGLDGDIANMLHCQIASALLEAGIIEATDESDEGNPDSILDRTGWVKVHGNWVLYAGYEKMPNREENVPITDEQIHSLYMYGQHSNGFLEFGYHRHRVTACNIPDIDKLQYPLKYFKF